MKKINVREVADLLLLVDVHVPLTKIRKWSIRRQARAIEWAVTAHFEASDNPGIHAGPCPWFIRRDASA